MNTYIILAIIIIVIILICVIVRKLVYSHLTNINNKVGFNSKANYLYDDYYEKLENSNGKDLIGNFSIFRFNFLDEIYKADLKILNLNGNETVLNLSQTNCNFDIYMINQFDNIIVYSLVTNLFDYKKCNDKIKKLNLDKRIIVKYGKYSDIGNIFKEIKFDRIVMLESIGKIKNKTIFIKQLPDLLKTDNSFIYIKTLVFKDIILNENKNNLSNTVFDKQKCMIKFWNYNFSTNQTIINEFHNNGFKNIKMKTLSILFLFFTYNIEDIINIIRLYFIDLNLGIKDLINWFILFTCNISTFIIKK